MKNEKITKLVEMVLRKKKLCKIYSLYPITILKWIDKLMKLSQVN